MRNEDDGDIYIQANNGKVFFNGIPIDGEMITISLQNGWTGTLNAHKFSKGLVGLTARINAGAISAGTIIANIPAGYRPYRIMPVLAFNTSRGVYLAGLYIRSSDGAIIFRSQSALTTIAEGEKVYFNIMYVGGN
jgi:hypothetical protein